MHWSTPGSLYATRYPDLAGLLGYWPEGGALACAAEPRCGAAPYGNLLTTNVVVGAEEALNDTPRQYLNRLSDLMFVLARVLNRLNGGDDVYWKSERLASGSA